MSLLVIILGLVLTAVGLFFAFGESGREFARGAGGKFSLEGPSWLLLVGIGVSLVVFGATYEFDNTGDFTAGETTTSTSLFASGPAVTTTAKSTTESTGSEPSPGCEVTISNQLAAIHEEPDQFSTEVRRVPAGTYPVMEVAEVEFVQQMQQWFRIEVGNQSGWIRDSTFEIASKSDACF